ncbi:MAG TPA: tetratricopeptide repeat protein [Candidatus Sulfotelmatobacter sp.]|nr:tetratricopeptide repeat protein [Candidatus Sulfotelmatobacter sp.]
MRIFGLNRKCQTVLALIGVAVFSMAAAGNDFKSLLQKAFDLHQRGQFSDALPLLREAYRLEPQDYFVNLLLGIDTLRTGEPKEAIPFLKKASRLRPREEFPLAYLGEAYARQKLYPNAAQAYLQAASILPVSADSAIALVDFSVARFGELSAALRSSKKGLATEYRLRALALAGNDPARVQLLQHAADLDPGVPGIWSALAVATLASGDRKTAQIDLQHALEANPNDLRAWIVDAELASAAADWKRASARLNAVAERSPQTLAEATADWPKELAAPPGMASGAAAKFFSCAQESKSSCDLGAAQGTSKAAPELLYREERWERLASLPAPALDRTHAWLQRGIAFAQLKDCRHAIPALERGVVRSADTYGMFLLSWCYSDEAGRVAQSVQGADVDAAPLHIMRGDILLHLQGKADASIGEYEQALSLHHNDPSILERLAEAQFSGGNNDAAKSNAEAALRLDPRRAGAKRTLAKIAMQQRDYAAALPYLRELAARDPQDVTGRIELAKAYAQTGAFEDARKNLAPALEQGYPDERGTLHYLLGTILKKMGQDAEAEQALAVAAQLSETFQHKSYHDQEPDAQP